MRTKTLALAFVLALPLAASAQFDFGGGGGGSRPSTSSRPWTEFKLPKTTMKLDFRNANIDMVLQLFQRTSGITIIKDPSLTGPFTITSAKAVPVAEAFQILNTTLGLKNFELQKEGNFLVIRPKRQERDRGQDNPFGGMDMNAMMTMFQGNQPQLKVYPITHANATAVARIVNEVFATVQDPMQQMMQQFGGMMGGGMQFGGRPGQNNNNRFGGGNNRFGGGGFQGFGGFGGRGGQGGTGVVRASADDFSNSIIVNAPTREQGQVAELIKQIDKQNEAPQTTKIYKLEFATAQEVTPTIQNVLVSNAPQGRGGQQTQNVPIEQRFQQALRLGGTQAAFGTVVADTRTNSVVVTATEANQALVANVIKELDTEVKYEASTFVFPLDNARADQMATLLQQAFGTRQGTGQNRNNFGNFGNQRTTNQNNRNNNRNNQNRLGGEVIDNGQALALDLEDPNLEGSDLYTSVAVQQGGFFGQFGGGNQNRTATAGAQGRTADGRLVNVRDLSGQVTVIPDQNTNSLVVVTTPENADLIKSILAQLDRIPEQVMIETIIVEATLDASDKLGVEWSLAQNKVFGDPAKSGTGATGFGLQNANPALEGFRYTLTGGDLSGFLTALKTDQKFQVLSTPRIFTSNNAEAEINISQSVPYVLSSREDANGNLTFNYAFQDVGIVLTVTPRITANGYVTMDVEQTANDLQGFTSFNAPIVNQRQANTTVSVRDGETIILGGIIRSTVSSTVKKVPLLGDIPILGELFKSTDKSKVKTELLVFLTPRVVKDDADAKKLRDKGVGDLSEDTRKVLEKWWEAKMAEEKAREEQKKTTENPPAKTGGGNQ